MSTTYLTNARRAVAAELGPFGVYSASGGSTTTAISGNAFSSSELPTDALAYAWVFVPSISGIRQRRITATGLNGSTGTITLDAALGTAIANGTTFEILTRLPAAREQSAGVGQAWLLGVHEAINLALRHCLIEDYISLTLVNGQYDYSLTPAWLDRPSRLVDVLQPNVLGTTYVSTQRTYEMRKDGSSQSLHFRQPFRISSGSYTLSLKVKRPADTLIAGADSTVGLVAETDYCELDLNTIVLGALVFCYDALRKSRQGADRAKHQGLYEEHLRAFRRSPFYDAENEIDPSVPAEAALPEAA